MYGQLGWVNVGLFNIGNGFFRLTPTFILPGSKYEVPRLEFQNNQVLSHMEMNTHYVSQWHSSYNETRVKSKFFSLMIYAGYPIA